MPLRDSPLRWIHRVQPCPWFVSNLDAREMKSAVSHRAHSCRNTRVLSVKLYLPSKIRVHSEHESSSLGLEQDNS